MKRITICVLAMLLTLCVWAGESWQLTILHTNDLHGWMRPFNFTRESLDFTERIMVDDRYANTDAGGLARRATLIARLRKDTTHPLVLIDAGDVFTRGPWQKQCFGQPEVEALNAMGYDLFCIGNCDFKGKPGADGREVLLGLQRISHFPWLGANLSAGGTGVPPAGISPFTIRRYGEMRVGFLGLTALRARKYPQLKGVWTIDDPIVAAKRWVPLARKECDILIAVTHLGVDLDKKLAAEVPGIDAIVGGDSHTFLRQQVLVKNPQGVEVPIVQAGAYGVVVGQLDLTFEKGEAGWRLTHSAGKLIPLDKSIPEDADMNALLDRWLQPAKQSCLPGRTSPLAA
ncbi:MAG TPA: metallophosphatase [Armatimonadota bacterium]|jgi:2',3'-cyclic-nucleotide 2'-phosphodiesterase (5'-nucleotidase family)